MQDSSPFSFKSEKIEHFRPQPLNYQPRPQAPQDHIPVVEESSPTYNRPGQTVTSPWPQTDTPQEHTGTTVSTGEPWKKHGLEIIGSFLDLYILCRSGDNLVVIDQHAAHERLLFEKLKKQFLSGKIAAQNLLFAQTVELSRFQSQLVEKNREKIERLGFGLREFGGSTYIISAVPALAGKGDPTGLFINILERFGGENEKASGPGPLEEILADMACKAAVRSGDRLSEKEIDALLNQMSEADLFSHCPHGRPVIKSFRAEEIKKWFYRT
jgi:DNA mismatch repair protein MutL